MGRRNLALHFQPLQSLMCCVFPCRARDLERVRSGNMPPQKTKAEIMFVLLLLLDYLITEFEIKVMLPYVMLPHAFGIGKQLCVRLYSIFKLDQYLLVVRGVSPRMSFPRNYSGQFCLFDSLLLLAVQCLDMSYLLRTDQKSIKNIYALNVRVFLEKLFKQQRVVIDTVRHAWKRFLGKYVRSWNCLRQPEICNS